MYWLIWFSLLFSRTVAVCSMSQKMCWYVNVSITEQFILIRICVLNKKCAIFRNCSNFEWKHLDLWSFFPISAFLPQKNPSSNYASYTIHEKQDLHVPNRKWNTGLTTSSTIGNMFGKQMKKKRKHQITFWPHVCLKTFRKATRLTLIPSRYIHNAFSTFLTCVFEISTRKSCENKWQNKRR